MCIIDKQSHACSGLIVSFLSTLSECFAARSAVSAQESEESNSQYIKKSGGEKPLE